MMTYIRHLKDIMTGDPTAVDRDIPKRRNRLLQHFVQHFRHG